MICPFLNPTISDGNTWNAALQFCASLFASIDMYMSLIIQQAREMHVGNLKGEEKVFDSNDETMKERDKMEEGKKQTR